MDLEKKITTKLRDFTFVLKEDLQGKDILLEDDLHLRKDEDGWVTRTFLYGAGIKNYGEGVVIRCWW